MRTIVMVALSTLTLFDAVGVAAEQSKAGTLLPGEMAWLIGTWEGEYVIPTSSLDVGPPGAKVITNNTWQWGLKKGFITLGIRDMIGDKVNLVGYELLGTDQATGELAHWFYGSDGGHGSGKWTRDGKNWKLTWECSVPDKRKVSGVSVIEPVDENTYTWQMVNIKENGKAIPDWPKVTYRRTIPEADGSDFWKEYVNLVKGSWSGSGKLGADNDKFGVKRGDAFTYRLTVQPIEAAASCICEGVLEVAEKNHRNEVRGLVGWDSAKKQVHWIAFWGGGLIEELFLTRCEGNKLYGSYVVTRGDGSTEDSAIVLDYSKPGTMEAKITSGQHRGETLSTWKREVE